MYRSSKIKLTNVCLVFDDKHVLIQEKLGLKEKYKGEFVFSGSHVESNESQLNSGRRHAVSCTIIQNKSI